MYWEEIYLWHQVRSFFSIYTRHINQIRHRRGALFSGKIELINVRKNGLLLDLIYQIHLNPQIHGIVVDYRNWPFSSFYPYFKRDRRSLLARIIFSDDQLYQEILDLHREDIFRENIGERRTTVG
jgi:hypothetical protein